MTRSFVSRRTILTSVLLLLLGALGGTRCAAGEKLNIDFPEQIHHNGLQLFIYYTPFLGVLTRVPVRDEAAVKGMQFYRVTVGPSGLYAHLDALQKLNGVAIIPVAEPKLAFLRVYAEFTTRNGEKVLSFALSADSEPMLLNGKAVQSHRAFYDVLAPFLPSCEVEEYRARVDWLFPPR